MKRTVLVMVLAISVLAVMSCKTTGKSGDTDDIFRKAYDKYAGHLILDGAETYTVQSGDILSRIAHSLYGDGYYYPIIMLASRDIVLDPDKIQPGMELIVPNLENNLADAKAKESIKGIILECAKIEENRGRAETAQGLRDHANKIE
jgi:hypothetical protein